ncbi:hypothetical protein PRZ48_010566 [Zasmidium cellare]|uniref:Uncharacterized protein n=1 Tax=Zasmidium cellare TaxID=395010 RepID=A0ABR0E912_ZASCE|nr:hypothetical protein PRZ48_010566 [Zasmidium cellare]
MKFTEMFTGFIARLPWPTWPEKPPLKHHSSFERQQDDDDNNDNDTYRMQHLTRWKLPSLFEAQSLPNLGITAMIKGVSGLSLHIMPLKMAPAPSRLDALAKMPPPPRPLITPAPPESFRFFDLPGELRNLIYKETLKGKRDMPNVTRESFEVPCPQILAVHPQIYSEVKDLLYVGKTFKFQIYHSRACFLDTCSEMCSQRCVRADWSMNQQKQQRPFRQEIPVRRPPRFQSEEHLLPSWTGKIFSAYLEVVIDPFNERLVSRGNILAALNSFLHVFAAIAICLEHLCIRFLINGPLLICPHLYSVLYPLTRCPSLNTIILHNVPDEKRLQAKLQRRLGKRIPCPPADFNKLKATVQAAQKLLWQAYDMHVPAKSRRRISRLLKRPEYQFRTKCDLTWHSEEGGAVWPIPPKRKPEGYEVAGSQQGMMSLCKGESYYRRLGKADLGALEREMGVLRRAIRKAEEEVLMRKGEEDPWAERAVDSGVDLSMDALGT